MSKRQCFLRLKQALESNDEDEIIDLFTNGVFDVNETCNGFTPLMLVAGAGNVRLTELFLRMGANPNHYNNTISILEYCMEQSKGQQSINQYIYVIQLLIENGTMEIQNTIGNTALHKAVKMQNVDFVQLLLEAGFNPNI